nr:hypothetical protein GCM10020093_019770 [Planobispora longispora]
MDLGDRFDQPQSQADALDGVVVGICGAIKALEHPLQLLSSDADTVVGDGDRHLVAGGCGVHGDGGVDGRVLDRIGHQRADRPHQQVLDQVLQPGRITRHRLQHAAVLGGFDLTLAQQIQIPAHRGQRGAQLVGDGGDEGVFGRIQLFQPGHGGLFGRIGLAQCLLGTAAFGDVVDEGVKGPFVVVAGGPHHDLDGELAAVGSGPGQLQPAAQHVGAPSGQ